MRYLSPSIDAEPIHRVRYLNAGRRGRTVSSVLPVLLGTADGLPDDLDALVLTSDLQGVVGSWRDGGAIVLLGVALVDELLELSERGVLPYPERTGVILAGDLFSAPGGDVRGASGDVQEVWHAFAAAYRWVAGVAGRGATGGCESRSPSTERRRSDGTTSSTATFERRARARITAGSRRGTTRHP